PLCPSLFPYTTLFRSQRRSRVAAVIGADLVDLVQHDDRIHRAGFLDRPNDPAGQRTDVRTPMTPDLRLVTDAAERHPDVLATERSEEHTSELQSREKL